MNLLHIIMDIQDDSTASTAKWSSLSIDALKQRVTDEFGSLSNHQFKSMVSEELVNHLSPIRESFSEFMEEPRILEKQLTESEKKCREIAAAKISLIHSSVGLL